MDIERRRADVLKRPFPIYPEIVPQLLATHAGDTPRSAERDPALAHILAVSSGYSAADLATAALIASRLGFGESACVRVHQVVDSMLIFATAYIVQSACGRVVVASFRGTEPANIGNWIADADVGPSTMMCGAERASVHAGFYRNLRAIRLPVLEELQCAVDGYSLLDHTQRVENPAEAIFITGHSLGGAMAALLGLDIMSDPEQRAVAARLRAVYTFGQPMVAIQPLPMAARAAGRVLYRHVMPQDLVPALPPVSWGAFVHFGNEYVCAGRTWAASKTPVVQPARVREVARTMLRNGLVPARRADAEFDMKAHLSQHYISALRPPGLVTEFGDYDG